jgi:hypothetical protein
MPVANARKHQVPAAGDAPSRAGIVGPFETINDIVPVANSTDRANVATAIAPTASRPLYVHRADAPVGQKLEVTEDGTTWRTILSYKGSTAWIFERQSASGTDTFPNGSMVTLVQGTIVDAPIGSYLITGTLILSAGSAATGNFRLLAAGANLSEDMRSDLSTQARPSSYTTSYTHAGGNLLVNLAFQAAVTATIYTNGSRITAAYLGP